MGPFKNQTRKKNNILPKQQKSGWMDGALTRQINIFISFYTDTGHFHHHHILLFGLLCYVRSVWVDQRETEKSSKKDCQWLIVVFCLYRYLSPNDTIIISLELLNLNLFLKGKIACIIYCAFIYVKRCVLSCLTHSLPKSKRERVRVGNIIFIFTSLIFFGLCGWVQRTEKLRWTHILNWIGNLLLHRGRRLGPCHKKYLTTWHWDCFSKGFKSIPSLNTIHLLFLPCSNVVF